MTLPWFKCLSSGFLASRIIHLMMLGLRCPNLPYCLSLYIERSVLVFTEYGDCGICIRKKPWRTPWYTDNCCKPHADLICSHKIALMSDDVQDVLQSTEWPFTERRRSRFIALQTKEETQLQIRNLIFP